MLLLLGGVLMVISHLLAGSYGVHPSALECTLWHESRWDPEAVNGVHLGLSQFRTEDPSTWDWMLEQALADPTYHHAHLHQDPDPRDPLQAIALTVWAFREGYQWHWSAYRFCWDIEMKGVR